MNRLLGVAAAALVASGPVLAQPELELFATTDAQAELVEQITRLRAEGGPAPEGTIAPLRALAVQYQEAGNDALAIPVLEEARYVTRVHRGLASADEALLLRQQIRSEEALGLDQRVWDLEQDMVTIARQHHDDIRMAPIFRDLAEDRTEVLEQYRGGYLPPEVTLGCYYVAPRPRYDDTRGKRQPPVGADGGCRTGQSGTVYVKLRSEILTYYADAIEVIVKNGDFASQELRDLEKQAMRFLEQEAVRRSRDARARGLDTHAWQPQRTMLATAKVVPSGDERSDGNRTERAAPLGTATRCQGQTIDGLLALPLLGTCLEPVIGGDGFVVSNVGGWVSLVRLIAYEMRSGAPAADRANAIAEFADWRLFTTLANRRRYGNGDRAVALYERARQEIRQGSDVSTWTTQVFAPEIPVTLPTFEPNPFAAAATAKSSRYIDVAFAVTKHGTAEQIEVLATSKDATRSEERDLLSLIEGVTFRPRVVDGELADAAPVSLRYNLDR